jgi:flagellar hook protein FlgE
LSQSTATMSGTSQVGRGVALGDIYSIFEQGSFESTGNTTDLAIGGDGFFLLREFGSENIFYSRAGNLGFDQDGYLTNPEGYVLQGWELDENGEDIGSVTDIVLDSFTSPPSASERINVITNLNSDATSNVVSLEGAWDGTDTTEPILTANYEYQTTVKVYDSLGSTHDITVYYDPDSATAGEWDYIITCNPSEDNRTISQADQAGLLARGTITFNTGSGEISGITMDTNDGDGTWTTGVTPNANGYLEFSSEFIGGSAQVVELNVGARHDGSSWVPDSSATTQFSRASTTTFQSSDGYGAGDLQGVDVDVDGVITGTYSNGQLIPLYRVALAKFQNVQGLNKEGGNLYRETRVSGEAITNRPGTNGLGSISPNSLEQSNVDIATEFVKMITTQRGFQANGKIITVTDSMLAELIQLKR